jgi:hypothetical protein
MSKQEIIDGFFTLQSVRAMAHADGLRNGSGFTVVEQFRHVPYSASR